MTLAAVFLQRRVDQAVEVAERAAAAQDPWHGLADFLTGTLELLRAHRGLHDLFAPDRAAGRHERLDNRIAPAVDGLFARGQRADLVRADLEAGDLGVVLQMLASVGDIPTDDQPGLLRRYLALLLASLRPTDEPCPAPRPARPRPARRWPGPGGGIAAESPSRQTTGKRLPTNHTAGAGCGALPGVLASGRTARASRGHGRWRYRSPHRSRRSPVPSWSAP